MKKILALLILAISIYSYAQTAPEGGKPVAHGRPKANANLDTPLPHVKFEEDADLTSSASTSASSDFDFDLEAELSKAAGAPAQQAVPSPFPTPQNVVQDDSAPKSTAFQGVTLPGSKKQAVPSAQAGSGAPQPAPAAQAAAQSTLPSPAPAVQKAAQKPVLEDPYAEYAHLWTKTKSNSFEVFKEKNGGMGTPNIESLLDEVYTAFRMQLPWLLTGRTNVYVYKNRAAYIRGQFAPPQWSRAVFMPSIYTIAFYDDPSDKSKLRKDFSHEYTHMVNEIYFNPKGEKGMSPPLWLDEGMAVLMEDMANSKTGADWANDLKTLNFRPEAQKNAGQNTSSFGIQRKRVQVNYTYLISFKKMMRDESLSESTDAQTWYLQAYAMVRFLWRPDITGSGNANKHFQFKKFLSYMTGVNDVTGAPIARRSTAQALKEAYGYDSVEAFERDFWSWLLKQKSKNSDTQTTTQSSTTTTQKSSQGYTSSFGYPSSSSTTTSSRSSSSSSSSGGLRSAKPTSGYGN